MNFIYKQSILGGTFDRFHLGHKKLVDAAFEASEQVTIGVTLPLMYQKKLLANLIEDYDIRVATLTDYLKEQNYLDRTTIIPIDNIYGTTLEEKNIDAIFATEENIPNVEKINSKRKEINFPELKLVTVSYVKDESGEDITSERIRKGEIDRSGLVYKNIFEHKIMSLSQDLREELQKPLGQVVSDTKGILNLLNEKTIVIAVGDIIVDSLTKEGLIPAISVIDLRTRRHDIEDLKIPEGSRVPNEQGTINNKAVDAFQEKLNTFFKSGEQQILIIEGEEDLLALPAILLAPLGAMVLYGQFDQGIVVNNVSEKLKNKILALLQKFNN